ncbi:MurR/RpiR family transcriptional regulator [Deferrisoma sp.]
MRTRPRPRDRVLAFAQAHPQEASYLTARELGERLGISESTVIRAVQAAGFEGYPEFQRRLRQGLVGRRSAAERLAIHGDPLSRSFSRDIENLKETWAAMPKGAFWQAAHLLAGAPRVWVFGLRMSHATAVVLELGLSFLGVNARLLAPRTADVWDQFARVAAGDVVVAVSFPRYTRIAVEGTALARRQGATVIAITDGPDSPLAPHAQVVLPAAYGIDGYVESFTASISLAQALLLAVGELRGEEGRKALEAREAIWAAQRVYWSPDDEEPAIRPAGEARETG